jgi:hypothetical protein
VVLKKTSNDWLRYVMAVLNKPNTRIGYVIMVLDKSNAQLGTTSSEWF